MPSNPSGIVVMFNKGVTNENIKQFIASYGFTGHCLNPLGEWEGKTLVFWVKVPDGEESQWVTEFKKRGVVKDATPNRPM